MLFYVPLDKEFFMSKSTAAIGESRSKIVHRTRGLRHGAITRLMSPSDLGRHSAAT
jgi:hypothetical protein